MNFDALYSSFEAELKEVEHAILDLFRSNTSLIPAIGNYIIRGGGKRIRPLFLLASTELFGYGGKDRIMLAGIIEAIHTASLIHDDVVDSAQMRRGQPAAHSVWNNQIVILVGDFLYSNALRVAVLHKNQMIMEHLSHATTSMTEGELLQLSRISDPEISEEEYLKIIAGKTGALISAACSIGAIVSGAGPEQIQALADFGMKTGMAFQMVDDILDYAAEEDGLGKKLGKDLEEGKITLPVIELYAAADKSERNELKEIICSDGNEEAEDGLKRIFDLFRKYDTINISMKKAAKLINDAKDRLDSIEQSLNKDMLKILADYALERDK
ncbi:octaprenyl-diphosphate synthase [bacterium BMS3Abin07]|nr:octaprenyl-diphosphate synthase [bacterium BMS3Abin07]GBE33157.1 octaprenyl-diphosphate synthase [bacterium BMS3Bbin05]HDL21177.1 polyprenyl synthetase family protein [Nitrospirota bacterium]HDO22641.1 polyprenyl synthetase family protein [Nitrospirota bacterium]HDZ87645.1 polyprenyl synthetase family protein [Nitrospirota bacterium]